jgi:hypothetical protein
VYIDSSEGLIVTFQPFLPRNDAIVVGAMRHVARALADTNIDKADPWLEDGLINFHTGVRRVSFLIVKEDTGEIHSFKMQKH